MTKLSEIISALTKTNTPLTSRQVAEAISMNYERNFNKREIRYAQARGLRRQVRELAHVADESPGAPSASSSSSELLSILVSPLAPNSGPAVSARRT
jgi:hypothetical protein